MQSQLRSRYAHPCQPGTLLVSAERCSQLSQTGLGMSDALLSVLQVALNMCTLTICGFLNMGIVKAGVSLTSQEERAHFLGRCRNFARNYVPGLRPPHPLRTFRGYWTAKCENDWRTAFGAFSAGAGRVSPAGCC